RDRSGASMIPRAWFVLVATCTLSGCDSSPEVHATDRFDNTVKPPAPLAIRWVRVSAERRAATLQTYSLATKRLEALANSLTSGTWAVSLDADETVLDNSLHKKELAAAGTPLNAENLSEWVKRKEATAVPGSVAFTKRVQTLGGRVVIVTNRTQSQC